MQSKQLLVILTTIITLTVNSLANIIPFNGQTSKQVSDKYFTTFTPAGYAFAIWSVIYIGLLAFTIYQALPSQKDRFNKVRDWVIISNLANALWLPLFHYEQFGLSILVILTLLFSLQRINLSLDNQQDDATTTWLVARIPFGIYFGWVSVATIANISVALTAALWNGFGLGQELWAVIILSAGLLVGLFVQSKIGAYLAYLLVFVWAYWAIYEGQTDLIVKQVAQLGAFVAVGMIVFRFVQGQKTASSR